MENKFEVGDVVIISLLNKGDVLAIVHEVIHNDTYRIWKCWTKSFGVWTDKHFKLHYRAEQVHGFKRIAVAETYLNLEGHNVGKMY